MFFVLDFSAPRHAKILKRNKPSPLWGEGGAWRRVRGSQTKAKFRNPSAQGISSGSQIKDLGRHLIRHCFAVPPSPHRGGRPKKTGGSSTLQGIHKGRELLVPLGGPGRNGTPRRFSLGSETRFFSREKKWVCIVGRKGTYLCLVIRISISQQLVRGGPENFCQLHNDMAGKFTFPSFPAGILLLCSTEHFCNCYLC